MSTIADQEDFVLVPRKLLERCLVALGGRDRPRGPLGALPYKCPPPAVPTLGDCAYELRRVLDLEPWKEIRHYKGGNVPNEFGSYFERSYTQKEPKGTEIGRWKSE